MSLACDFARTKTSLDNKLTQFMVTEHTVNKLINYIVGSVLLTETWSVSQSSMRDA